MYSFTPKDKRIFITGGTGFLGRSLIERLYKKNEIIIYSRDEAKHHFLKEKYPNVHFILGDIRDKELLNRSAKGANIGIFAASLKQISSCDQNPEEALQTIANGAINSKHIAIENKFDSAIFISSDKSRAATTIYGSLKYFAGEQFILKNNYERHSSTNLSTVIYGNVLNSTGSIIPMIWKSINSNTELTLFSKKMTRFIIDVDQAIDLIFEGISYDQASLIPKSKSIKVLDLFEIYKENFNLKFNIGYPRIGEKIHEVLVTQEEMSRLSNSDCGTFYILKPFRTKFKSDCTQLRNDSYSSKDCLISKSELNKILNKFNYFKP
ncbi:putative nucleoside-diphosphate sugar epimerase [Prochlorococcus marinus str. NATL2A]|uniref:Nucleoside-diphosphate sugar epimerase n=1 Tax=Prochlorococcus marinus (strain NATL2A) TaxID=59920 RepID=Q46IF3_PROMT|nr:polysaccharide biosynthesis protein [Prochlorococcus marinus]AAZ58725.1 putative nucleoside-diphosphate sugar epimerase [Prochlorococcus marinus str. NATL2A]